MHYTFLLAPTLIVVGSALALLPILNRDTTAGRLLPCLICELLILRTLYWRLTQTLPPFDLTVQVLWPYLFAALETLSSIGSMFLFMFLARSIDRRPDARRNRDWALNPPLKVAILIATVNEERDILERTIIGALNQTYPNCSVYVLDDGRRDWLKRLCAERGIVHVTRPDRAHAKSGNLNHALRLIAAYDPCEYIAVLDADFIAQPNFVTRAVALFRDPSVACVQTPQHFYNPDPLQHGFNAKYRWPDEQRFFFDVLLTSKDAWGVAFSCGTSSLLRSKALAEIGGFPTESVTEDMLLSLKLKAAGWKTVYLNERLSVGLAPEGVAEYITQRGRWCLGFMQIARSAWGPLGSASLPLIDRLSLLDAFLYWGTSFPFRIACCAAPAIFGLTGFAVFSAGPEAILSHYGASVPAVFLVLIWITRGRILPIVSDAAQLLVTFHAIRAAAVGFFMPKGHPFKVTPKGGDRSRVIVQWRLLFLFLSFMGATMAAIVYGTLNESSPIYGNQSAPIWLFWANYNVLTLLVAALTCIELPRPSVESFRTDEMALATRDGHWRRHPILQISTVGATLGGRSTGTIGSNIAIRIAGIEGTVPARIVGRRRKAFDVAFHHDPRLSDALVSRLYSGAYDVRSTDFRVGHVVTAITGRFLS